MAKDKYIVLQQWMYDYDLSLRELAVYATIYGFSQDGQSCFYGSLQYLADWTKSSKRQVQNILDSLIEKKLISKSSRIENNVKQCFYKALRPKVEISQDIETIATGGMEENAMVWQPLPRGIETIATGYSNDCHAPMATIATNNKYIINIKERENKRENAFSFVSAPEYANQLFDKWNEYGFLNRGKIEFLNRFETCLTHLKGIHSDDVFKAIDNYKKVKDSGGWYAKKHNLTFESFCKNIQQFLDGNFDIHNFCDVKDAEKIEEQEEVESSIQYFDCPKCGSYRLFWNDQAQKFNCKNCAYICTWDEFDTWDCKRRGIANG